MNKEDDIVADARRVEEAAEGLQQQADALRQAASQVYDRSIISDAQSLHRMADYIQGRADTARRETERLQGVADRLRQRARAAEQHGDSSGGKQ